MDSFEAGGLVRHLRIDGMEWKTIQESADAFRSLGILWNPARQGA
jgi:hypothetical protein